MFAVWCSYTLLFAVLCVHILCCSRYGVLIWSVVDGMVCSYNKVYCVPSVHFCVTVFRLCVWDLLCLSVQPSVRFRKARFYGRNQWRFSETETQTDRLRDRERQTERQRKTERGGRGGEKRARDTDRHDGGGEGGRKRVEVGGLGGGAWGGGGGKRRRKAMTKFFPPALCNEHSWTFLFQTSMLSSIIFSKPSGRCRQTTE